MKLKESTVLLASHYASWEWLLSLNEKLVLRELAFIKNCQYLF
jgi:hypothetical protein